MDTPTVRKLLRRFQVFQDLTDFEIEPIVGLAKQRIYQAGSHVFLQGDPLTNIYFIYEGTVKIYRTDTQGKEQIVNMLNSGSMFPHQGFFRQDNYPAHAEAINDVTLIYIPIQSFEELLMTHPDICIKIFKVLGDMIVDLQARLEEKILHNTHEQIILLLLRLVKKHGEQITADTYRMTTAFTNRELANMIGSSRETVNRTLSKLKKDQCIDLDHNRNLIIYPEALANEISI